MPPETQYASVGHAMVAYQVMGEGPRDLVLLRSMLSNVEVEWESPALMRQRERLASFSRLIMLDRRGLGLSDPLPPERLAEYEHWNDDLLAVLDAVASKRASLFCEIDASLWGLLFAATYPQRVEALVLWNGMARSLTGDDYPFGYTPDSQAAMLNTMLGGWGTEDMARVACPDGDEAVSRFIARLARASLTPASAVRRSQIVGQIDVRSILPTIRAPTLVLHRTDNAFVDVGTSRYVADHISGATFAAVDGRDVHFWDEQHVLDLIEEFITGEAAVPTTDRALATLLFTDIVGSTDHVTTLGDRRWRQKLDAHDSAARSNVERFAGRLIKTTGDGMLATFDGPGKAIRCAHALQSALKDIDVRIRAGLHTGEVELRGDDIGGLAVHIGARVMGAATEGEVWCTRTVRDLVAGSGITFEDRGSHRLRGVPDEWHLFAVSGS